MIDCQARRKIGVQEVEAASDSESLIESGQKVITQMAGEIVHFWTSFKQSFLGKPNTTQYLMEMFRRLQLKRLGEGVFLVDHLKSNLLSPMFSHAILDRHDAVWEIFKQSRYYTDLPALPVACLETDGTTYQIPVLFEDR